MDSISNHSQKTIIIGMLGVFLVAFVWAFFSFGNFWSTEDITVPDVTGKQVEIAKKILKDKKLDVSVKGSGKRRSASRRSHFPDTVWRGRRQGEPDHLPDRQQG